MNKKTASCASVAMWALAAAGCSEPAIEHGITSMKENVHEAGQAIDDAALTTRVKAALAAEEALDGGAISVGTKNGRVTLSGELPAAQIPLAEDVARGIDGVRDVDNRLRPTTAVS